METQKCENFSKSSKLTKLNSVRTPSFRMPRKKSPWLRQYQSYVSNWYVNGKVFTSTTTWESKNLTFFFQRVRNWIRLVVWRVLKSWNHSSRSQHAPICRHRGCIVVPWGSTSSCNFKQIAKSVLGLAGSVNFCTWFQGPVLCKHLGGDGVLCLLKTEVRVQGPCQLKFALQANCYLHEWLEFPVCAICMR